MESMRWKGLFSNLDFCSHKGERKPQNALKDTKNIKEIASDCKKNKNKKFFPFVSLFTRGYSYFIFAIDY